MHHTIVTVTLVQVDADDDNNVLTTSASRFVDVNCGGNLNDSITEARDEATELFTDNYMLSSRHRYIVQVMSVPEIPIRQTFGTAVLPQTIDDAAIQATVE
jgi:hypothetical protein